ncbi:MAG: isoprenylcysteine carboxylmethyltransferase family protein [Alphaproteobacteria bacterium]|jgi:protein-S-isoprenylcysteine O-methyltransferase Ste14|uniref:methyltransferase family protein n=1 Tax=Brevundimonas sp. TaxID=1871086 RepID=UPI0017C12269|nr:isoprenylcysteine carboxylmethyltransferase family protein [Brevundimonas sp.]MBU3970366.1 isoprenylcysteine carboxylmethyltransferase family protein [Alphaproteobacteria bacterium]MBA3049197.1 isoprenylcysteine carboxylmethyltransferase family protein [Brevundimonas sp.]MBU3974236.1 isoprenylcysteine carboxylmethyltransferase family protein [Alphaproteobacteria bacterium]MBU4039362.1 isoprenylcysteine carboxylmethyltransferase family protein [Alphaproteobacteria bacterium]MBU4136395.1 isop
MTQLQAAPLSLDIVQHRRKWFAGLALLALLALAASVRSVAAFNGAWHEGVEAFGLALIIIAIVGRGWCSLYIGGRKKAEIVDRGPYSVTRNPLYVFSFIGAFGIGAQTGSLVIGAAFAAATFLVFLRTVGREEAWLAANFGDHYDAYRQRTPRFWPNPRLWRDAEELTIRPAFFVRTLRDGLTFLAAIPVMEGIERLQAAGLIGLPIGLF